jgi:hypothetical protein
VRPGLNGPLVELKRLDLAVWTTRNTGVANRNSVPMRSFDRKKRMNQLITVEQINAGIDPKYQPFFQVGAATMYRSAFPLIEALWEAIRIFAPLVRLDHPAHVLIGAAPFAFL